MGGIKSTESELNCYYPVYERNMTVIEEKRNQNGEQALVSGDDDGCSNWL